MVFPMYENNNNDTKLTDTKSTKLDAERSKREDMSFCETCKNNIRIEDSFDWYCPKCLKETYDAVL
jgi:Zn finger protein HypA/HybF involved in hydrogenase expression